ncbi:basic proline-rich protein-like [Cervus elaphus]|uniref:basic proline-rich protein-like n=1 Tax=Cervus elaphus TaxID=9860 RepID=UPI001CC2AE4B|nr:basic proline-rich protein-like [Cervus elaphus]
MAAATRGSSRRPSGGRGRGLGLGGLRRVVVEAARGGHCGQKRLRAARPPARPRHRGAHTRPWQGKSSRPPALSVRLPWRAVLLSAASKHCARHRLLAHTPKAARQLPGSLLPALSAPNAPAGRAAELSKSRRRIPAPTPRQREALRRRRRHQQPTSNPIRASSTQRPGSTGPTAPGRRSRGLAAPRPFAPRRGPRTPPPSPPGGNAGHAASSSQLAKALLHRALGEATSHDDRGTREPAACRRHGALPRRAGREPRSPLRQPLWAGGPQDPAMRRSAVARRLVQRRTEETKGPWGPGGRTESHRGHQKGCVASPSGNRTPVSRVTGGDTHHYTNEDGGDRPAARPLSGSRAACPRLPRAQHGPRPDRPPNQPPRSQRRPATPTRTRTPRGTGHSSCAPPLASNAAIPPGEGGPRRQARLRGHGGRAPARVWRGGARVRRGRPAKGRAGSGARPAAQPGASAGPVAHPRQTAACLPGAAHRAARHGRRGSRRVGSQPGERPRARPGPPSGWPSGLRRCVQVAVSPGGVGSNPTPDKPAFWPAGQTHPSSPRHSLSPHTPAPRHQEPSVLLSAAFLPRCLRLQLLLFRPPRLRLAHPRPPSHSQGPTPPHPRRRRRTRPRAGWRALLASRAPRLLPAERPSRSRSLASTSAPGRSPSGRHPVVRARAAGPPAPPSHTQAAEPPRLARQGAAACPPRFSALRPRPGHTCLPPARDARHAPLLRAGEHRPSVHEPVPGRALGWGGSGSPACPSSPATGAQPAPRPSAPPRPFPGGGGEAAARAGAKRGLACSLPQPAVPEPGAALPKGPSSPPPPPTLSERSARERRRPERRSQAHNAFGSWGLSAARGGGGGAPGSRAPALASTQHRPSPGSRPPPAMVAERNVGARPRRPRSACPRRRRRLLAPSGDTDSVAAAVVGAEGAGPAEWAGGPPPRGPSESAAPWGPARARTLALRSAARRLLLGWSRQMPTGRAVSSDGRVLASASGAASGGGGHRCMGGSVLPTTPPAPTHGPAAKPLWPQALRAQPPVCPDTSLVVAGFLTRTQPVAHGLRWKAHPTSGSRRPHLFTFPNVCLQAPWLTLATLRESITLPSALLRQ